MLHTAARRHAQQQLLRTQGTSACTQLQYPWILRSSPHAPKRRRISTRPHVSPTSSRSTTRSRRRFPNASHRRSLATAVDPYQSAQDEAIPFEGITSPPPPRYSQHTARADGSSASLREFDTSNLILVPYNARDALPPRFRGRKHSQASGDLADLQQNLYACVSVGRLERAADLVRRISSMLVPTAPEVLDAHHRYLAGMLDFVTQKPSRETLTTMQRWLELDIREEGVPVDGRTLSIVMKAALLVLKGSQLDRTLRRYLTFASDLGSGVGEDALASDIFTDVEWCRILKAAPTMFQHPVDMSEDSPPAPQESAQHDEEINLETKDLPDIKDAQFKGAGLEALRSSLRSIYTAAQESTDEEAMHTLEQALEQQTLESAVSKWHQEAPGLEAVRTQHKITKGPLSQYMQEWISKMAPLLKQEIAASENIDTDLGVDDQRSKALLAPFLRLMPADQICAAAILSFLTNILSSSSRQKLSKNYGQVGNCYAHTVSYVLMTVGHDVGLQLTAETLQSSARQKMKGLPLGQRRRQLAKYMRKGQLFGSHHQSKDSSESSVHASSNLEVPGLNLTVNIESTLGAVLVSLMLKVATIPVETKDPKTGQVAVENQPIAYHTSKWDKGKKRGIIDTNPKLVERLKKDPLPEMLTKYPPMLVEPKKWQGLFDGPYLHLKSRAVRLSDSSNSQLQYLKLADQRGDLKQIYEGLDVIGKVPWRVHKDLLKVMVQVWNTGEKLAKFAPESPKPQYPPEPDRKEDPKAHYRWRQITQDIDNEIMGFHSERCYQNFQLHMARAFVDKDIYCPHNVDFRGRAYPIPPYFNHMGADNVRALFQFSKGMELGEAGLTWLKIHLANVYGYDKESLQDRETFADDHLSDIYDSVANPLDGRRWWLTADEPWQCLAACMELKNALDSPVPSKYVSHLPVQQDGSCNGLQHYAALGGDEAGAKQVNLAPGNKPADVYSAVADLVKQQVAKDAKEGDLRAQMLDGKITRKIVKQPVMTNVYGVTSHGAGQQVRKQLTEILPRESLDNNIHLGNLSRYVADLIFKALAEMFHGARLIQTWLGECGERISTAVTPEQISRVMLKRAGKLPASDFKAKPLVGNGMNQAMLEHNFKSSIVWTTPLGLPVVQPYREGHLKKIRTPMQDIFVKEVTAVDPVSKRKQLQAFPPNFIHSLDASHMMLSALKCNELGLTFAAVHDSFWTHACNVDTMNKILRDAMIRMHSENIVGRLREEFQVRYKDCLQLVWVRTDSPVGQKIVEHFNKRGRPKRHWTMGKVETESQIDDLLREYERQTLMKSEDAEEQKKGGEMETPASLFEASDGDYESISLGSVDSSLQSAERKSRARETAAKSANAASEDIIAAEEAEPEEQQDTDVFAPDESGERSLQAISDVDADETIPDSSDTSSSKNTASAQNSPAESSAADAHPPAEAEAEEEGKSHDQIQHEEAMRKRRASQRAVSREWRRNMGMKVHFWAPIKFPQPPERGSFDVRELEGSVYFFS
ncbi:MAG: DNA-directed RNA polymerase [Alyxoria varia]|nr:MAG: DNA-directed RNA polymerase [Alyxoria varia]